MVAMVLTRQGSYTSDVFYAARFGTSTAALDKVAITQS
jgi:hypothetical protein